VPEVLLGTSVLFYYQHELLPFQVQVEVCLDKHNTEMGF